MHKVKCYYCEEVFDRDKEPVEKVTSRRYAHKACYDKYYQRDDQYEELIYYYLSKEVFLGMVLDNSWYQMLKRQLVKYIQDGYTYEGIYQALRYHYDVKKGDPTKSGGRIGIVPYVYDEAQKYYLHKEKQSLAALAAFEKTAKEATTVPIVIPRTTREPVKLLDMNSIFSEDNEC